MRARVVRVGLVVAVALTAATAVSGNAAPAAKATPVAGTFVVTGPAGGEALIRLIHPADVELRSQLSMPPTVSRGGYAGVVMTSASGADYLSIATGRSGPGCAFATRCTAWDSPQIDGSRPLNEPDRAGFHLPAGTYTVGLVGEPGSTVTAKLGFGSSHVTRVVHTTASGHLRATQLASIEPAAAGEQPLADGTATLDGPRGLTFMGIVMRWDLVDPHQVSYNVCLSTGDTNPIAAFAAAGVVSCPGNSGGGSGQQAIEQCSTVAVACVPLTTGPFVLTVSSIMLRTATKPVYVASTSAQAVQSQITVTAFALTL